jgi:hypothetical protein
MTSDPPELTLEEMLADPIVRLVMLRDGTCADEVRAMMEAARRRLGWGSPPAPKRRHPRTSRGMTR